MHVDDADRAKMQTQTIESIFANRKNRTRAKALTIKAQKCTENNA